MKKLDKFIVIGNSLGGHIGLLYTLNNATKVEKLILTGSSGLFEDSMGGSYPKRGNYEYVRERVAYTFYDPKVATKELVDEVFEITNSIPKCLRIVAIAKSAQRNNLADEIRKLRTIKRGGGRELSLEQSLEQSSLKLEKFIALEHATASNRLMRKEQLLQLTTAMSELPPAQREALILQHWQGHTLAEIAAQTGRTRVAVAGLIKRAIQTLREHLIEFE